MGSAQQNFRFTADGSFNATFGAKTSAKAMLKVGDSDDLRVGADGYYYFQQLLPGTYEVYTFTEDLNEVPSPVFQTVTVTEAGQVYDLELFSIVVNV